MDYFCGAAPLSFVITFHFIVVVNLDQSGEELVPCRAISNRFETKAKQQPLFQIGESAQFTIQR